MYNYKTNYSAGSSNSGNFNSQTSAKIKKLIKVTAIILIVFIFLGISTADPSTGSKKPQYLKIKVERGDTLWKIVKSFYGNKYNIRKIIYKIKEINHMENVILHPGDIIKLPKNIN